MQRFFLFSVPFCLSSFLWRRYTYCTYSTTYRLQCLHEEQLQQLCKECLAGSCTSDSKQHWCKATPCIYLHFLDAFFPPKFMYSSGRVTEDLYRIHLKLYTTNNRQQPGDYYYQYTCCDGLQGCAGAQALRYRLFIWRQAWIRVYYTSGWWKETPCSRSFSQPVGKFSVSYQPTGASYSTIIKGLYNAPIWVWSK